MLLALPSDEEPRPLMTPYILSPSRSASARRRRATMPRPSPSMVPSASAEKGLQSPVGDRAGVLLKHMYMNMSLRASAPPVMTRSEWPACSSCIAMATAPRLLAQAASITQLVPPRSRRLAILPATTLPSKPGNVLSSQAG